MPGVFNSKRWALGSHFWGENLQGAKSQPARLPAEKLAYSPHVCTRPQGMHHTGDLGAANADAPL